MLISMMVDRDDVLKKAPLAELIAHPEIATQIGEALTIAPPKDIMSLTIDMENGNGDMDIIIDRKMLRIEPRQVNVPSLKGVFSTIPMPNEVKKLAESYFAMFPNRIVGDATFEFEHGEVRYTEDTMSGVLAIPFGFDAIDEITAQLNSGGL